MFFDIFKSLKTGKLSKIKSLFNRIILQPILIGIMLLGFSAQAQKIQTFPFNLEADSKIDEIYGFRENFVVSTIKDNKNYVQTKELLLGPYNCDRFYCADNGKDIAFVFTKLNKQYIWYNNMELGPYKYIGIPKFSSDGSKMAFIADIDERKELILSDNPGNSIKNVTNFGFFGKSNLLCYCAKIDDKKYQFVCGTTTAETKEEVPVYTKLGPLQAAYILPEGKKKFVIMPDKKLGPFDDASFVLVDAQRDHLVIATKLNKKWSLYIGNKTYGEFDAKPENISFSNEGKHFWTKVKIDGKSYLLFDNEKFGPFESISDMNYSTPFQTVFYGAKKEDRYYIMKGNKELVSSADYLDAKSNLSQNNEMYAVQAKVDGKHYVYTPQKKYGPFTEVLDVGCCENLPLCVYVVKEAYTQGIYLNDKLIYSSSQISDIDISDDGQCISFVASGNQWGELVFRTNPEANPAKLGVIVAMLRDPVTMQQDSAQKVLKKLMGNNLILGEFKSASVEMKTSTGDLLIQAQDANGEPILMLNDKIVEKGNGIQWFRISPFGKYASYRINDTDERVLVFSEGKSYRGHPITYGYWINLDYPNIIGYIYFNQEKHELVRVMLE